MRLTIEELSKRTKLSVPTLRVYVSRQKLGTRIGNNRFFSQADVEKLMKGSKRGAGKGRGAKARKTGPAARSARAKQARSRPARAKPVRKAPAAAKPATPVRPAVAAPVAARPEQKPVKRSFWSRLFGGRRPPQKISLMQAKKS